MASLRLILFMLVCVCVCGMVNESISLEFDCHRRNKLTHISRGTEMMNEFLLYKYRTGQSVILTIFLSVNV